jgi:steroid delta-isomerase-like uncharacterized protein
MFLLSVFLLAFTCQTRGQDGTDPVAIRAAFAQALHEHDAAKVASFFTEDGVWDYVADSALYVGREQIQMAFDVHFTGSPDDWRTDEGLVLSVDNIVVVEHAALGTQTGPFPGLPPTGKEWIVPHIDIYEMEGDKIKRLTSYLDAVTFYIQLGAMPAPEVPSLVPSIAVPDHEPTGLSPMEANAEAIRRWNGHDPAVVAKMYHDDAKIFAGPLGAEVDRVAMTAMNEMYFAAFPNVKQEVVRTIDLGDNWVLTEFVTSSTQQGPFMGIPASGYPLEIRVVWLMHYSDDGLLIQGSFYYDNLTLMTQMTEPPECSPDGTWIVTVPTEAGVTTLLHTISPQGQMGGPFARTRVQVNENPTAFGIFPEADGATDWITKTVWKGRESLETTMLVYGTKSGEGPLRETVYIGLAHAEWTLTGPDTNEGTAVEAFYLAEQDADGDGFPDAGEEPLTCLPFTFTSRRLNMMAPCVPSALP